MLYTFKTCNYNLESKIIFKMWAHKNGEIFLQAIFPFFLFVSLCLPSPPLPSPPPPPFFSVSLHAYSTEKCHREDFRR